MLSWTGNLSLSSTSALFDPNLVPYSHALGINEAGNICGQLNFDPNQLFNEAFLLMSGELVPLKPLVDDDVSATRNASANALNDPTGDHGVQVVGGAYVYDRATGIIYYDPRVLWDEDQSVVDLTAFGGRKTRPVRVKAIADDSWVTGSTFNERKGLDVPLLMIPK